MAAVPLSESFFVTGAPVTELRCVPLPTDDAGLVLAARAGDRRAEEQIYRRHVRYLGGLLNRLLGNCVEAEDALQETFVIALDRFSELRDPAALRGWLAQIAVSQARRRFRRAKLLRALGFHPTGDDAVLDLVAAPHAPAAAHAEVATLVQLVSRLGADERIAWLLRHVSGESLEDVAAHCDCSLATAKRRIAVANAFIRAELARDTGAVP